MCTCVCVSAFPGLWLVTCCMCVCVCVCVRVSLSVQSVFCWSWPPAEPFSTPQAVCHRSAQGAPWIPPVYLVSRLNLPM